MDVRLPDGSGIEACREIRAEMPETRVVILTSYPDEDAVLSAIIAGASGYLLKQVRARDLVAALEAVGRGESLLDPAVTGRVLERVRRIATADQPDELAQLDLAGTEDPAAGRRGQDQQGDRGRGLPVGQDRQELRQLDPRQAQPRAPGAGRRLHGQAPRRRRRRRLSRPMRALVLERPRPIADEPLELVERDDPQPADDELILRVTACAVCRTDLQIVDRRPAGAPLAGRARPPGGRGWSAPSGPPSTGWAIGERAGITWLAGFDGTCRFCRSGRENLCRAASFTGWDRDGGYASAVAVRADVAVRIPAGLDDLAAAPLLCGGVIAYRALRLSGIEPGARLGLYGFGASARQAIQVAPPLGLRGPRRVTRAARPRAGAGARRVVGRAAMTIRRRPRSMRRSRSRRSARW